MNALMAEQATLGNRSIWIIDDDIPLQASDFEKDDMLEGSRPIDRGTLLSLFGKEDEWDDKRVLEVCREMVSEAGHIDAFLLPTSAIAHLKKGAKAPDLIIFDMKYRNLPGKDDVLQCLKIILSECIAIVQVYTKEALEEAEADLKPLSNDFNTRLRQPLRKTDTNADTLANILSEHFKNSLSAQLAANIRRLSTMAIESVLVNIDKLPLEVAIRLLAGDNEEKLNDIELIELLSAKVGNYLKSSRELSTAIKEYAQKSGVPTDKNKQFVDAVADLIATSVRNNIQYDKWIYDAIQSAKKQAAEGVIDDETKKRIKKFFAYRVYDQPGDEIVRTGDIISFPRQKKKGMDTDYPDLYLILTPACDLAHFWWKTRGVLTLVKMYPILQNRGINRIKFYEHKVDNNPQSFQSSITAKNPFLFPSVIVGDREPMDYLIFVHEMEFREFDGTRLTIQITDVKTRKKFYEKQQLTYDELLRTGKKVKRECRVSEPFLGGVLSEIRNVLFRDGVPDFPDEEKNRLLSCLNQ